jgi:ribosomal-protein-alanine N-acetyltransferase
VIAPGQPPGQAPGLPFTGGVDLGMEGPGVLGTRIVMTEMRLREWRPDDASAIVPVLDDPEVSKWSHIAQIGTERWVVEQREGRRGTSMAVCESDGDTVVGKVALRLPGRGSRATTCEAIRPDDHPVGELSYWVLPHARGRGVATAAATAMLDLAREMEGVRSVVLDIETDNLASIRVAERIGATRREPPRVERDRNGVRRTLAVFIVRV